MDVLSNELPALAVLAGLAEGAGRVGTEQALLEAARYLGAVYGRGVGHTLEHIAECGVEAGNYGVVRAFLDSLTTATASEDLCIATLNYDGLLYGALDGGGNFSDLGAGNEPITTWVVASDQSVSGVRLRIKDDYPTKIQLVQLRGSLGWLSCDGAAAKFSINDLRNAGYWAAFRDGRTRWAPTVVLTNQPGKTRRVTEWPFSLAYSIFESRLCDSSYWLLSGYGLGDQPVNETLARAASMRRGRSESTTILVQVKDTATGVDQIREKLSLGQSDELILCVCGLPTAVACKHWTEWHA